MKDRIDNFIDAMLEVRWASGMSAANAQRVAAAMVYATRDPNIRTANALIQLSNLIVWRGNETREVVDFYFTAKADLVKEVTA